MTPRPRSKDKVIPISIGIPQSLSIRLENILDYQHSRSRWVCKAIMAKLAGKEMINQIDYRDLLHELYEREILTLSEYKTYLLRAKSLFEEIEEQ